MEFEGPAILRDVFSARRVFDSLGNVVELSSNIAPDEAAILQRTVQELRPEMTVETGFGQGISTLAILDALRANGRGHHHVIDPFQERYAGCGPAMVKRAGLEGFYTFHARLPEEVIPTLPKLQFAFVDSSHLFDLTIAEFVMIDRKLGIGGVIGFHDMWMPAQQSVLRYVLANRQYEPWLPSGWSTATRAARNLESIVRNCIARLPWSDRVFAAEFLKPWREFGLGNLGFLRKRADDTRDWQFHRRF